MGSRVAEELSESPASVQTTHANPERWVDEHGDCLFHFALTRVRRREVAEDLVQDALLAAVRTADNFGGRSSERSWLVGILKNKIADYFRKLGRETSFTDLEFFSDEHSEKFQDKFWNHDIGPMEWRPEGEEALNRAEFWEHLHLCLSKMPPRVASVFVMREVDDVPPRDVCSTFSISDANLWVMLHRARMALRLCLEENYFTDRPPA
jgi:RNA polymerase sigma-70 factor (TIGR02943 family)